MAWHRGEAWVTYVPKDDVVSSAMVLAASLRRTMTSRSVAVIVAPAVSKESRKMLRQEFNSVYLLDKELVAVGEDVPSGGGTDEKDDQMPGKIFAFSLRHYRKCIFLPATGFLLENCDDFFGCQKGDDWVFRDFSENSEIFLFTPNLALCEFLEKRRKQSGLGKDFFVDQVKAWQKNNASGKEWVVETGCGSGVVSFSVGDRMLLMRGQNQVKMIYYADFRKKEGGLEASLRSLLSANVLGLTEKKITGEWLKMLEDRVACVLLDPQASIFSYGNNERRLYGNEPIAIVGMSCRYPGANNLEEFWNLLYLGEEGICLPPAFRWKKEHTIIGAFKERETNAGFLTTPVDEFDSKFFGISPKDMEFLDPQARLLHEVMWEGLEDSGIDPMSLHGSHTGIFVGSWLNEYKDIVRTAAELDFFRAYMGNSIGGTAARLSFLLGLTGPSIATESGCSSAIVGVDLAIKSLRNGETNLAIAAGVNLLLHPFQSDLIDYVIAPDGRCKTFDEKANGFGRAEGCGVLVLKRLSDALRDRDHIWATIRGSAISQEGLSRSLGTPTVHCEALAMQLALRDAGVRPEQVSFVETHGTGTIVGDPMEVAAIAKVYNSDARKDPLIIGSVKTNVGHTESCSGITGIMKTVLAMQNEIVPKHLNFDTINPEINLEAIPAKIPLEPIPWPKIQGQTRIAGVSSFGLTGTDGHVIIEEAPDYSFPKFTVDLERPLHLIKFSAKSKEALVDVMKNYEEIFMKEQENSLKDIAYSSNTGRASFNHRAFLLASSLEEAATSIQSDKLTHGDTFGKETGKVCFLFTGQCSQYAGMAKSLYETSPVFRLHFDQCDNILRNGYDLSLSEALWESGEKSKELSRTIYSQTSIFCIEYCLLKLWESWGVQPDCVLGHSLGEFCAAVAAGILTFEDALMLVAERSRLIDALPRGSMFVIKASQPEVDKLMKDAAMDLDYAAVNSSEQTVVAGDAEKIQKLLVVCKEKGLKAVILEATHAFHSRHMDPMLAEYRKIAETIKCSTSPKCQYISGMKGRLLENFDSEMNADYWVDHTREKVSFLGACNAIKELNCQHFVEIGPQPVLSTYVMQNIDNQPVSCYPSLRRNTNDWETILTSLGKLYLNGVNVDWEGYDAPFNRIKIPSTLPFHPFYRKPFWTDCGNCSLAPLHPLIGSSVNNASALSIFQNNLNLKSVPYLKDHCIGERVVMPGAGFAEMCLSAGHCVADSLIETLERPRRPVALENLIIEAPLAINEGKLCRLQVIVDLPQPTSSDASASDVDTNASCNGFRVKIFRQTNVHNDSVGKWNPHASATFNPVVIVKDIMSKWQMERVKELISTSEEISTQPFYKRVDGVGLKFGDLFKSIGRYWGALGENKKDEIVAEVKLPKDHGNYLLHPIVIDAMIQCVILSSLQTQAEVLIVPTQIGKLVWLNDVLESSSILYLHSSWENDNCSIFAADETFNLVAFMADVQMIETNVRTIESILEQQNRTLPDSWEEIWKPVLGPLDKRVINPILEPVLDTEEFAKRLEEVSTISEDDWYLERKTRRLLYLYEIRAFLKLGWKPVKDELISVPKFCEKHKILPIYHQLIHHYFNWCHNENRMMTFNEEENVWRITSLPESEEEVEGEIQKLIEHLKGNNKVAVVTKVYSTLGDRLHRLLCGEESVLPLLFPLDANQQQDCSADLYYQNYPGRSDTITKANETYKRILGTTRTANKGDAEAVLRVLEVGAGTGSLTQEVLPKIVEIWGSKVEYWYTDISGAFFAKADLKFAAHKKLLKFCVFDIEKNGFSQGVPMNYFDVMIATDVLHTTKNLEQTVRNIGGCMRPNGFICFTETFTQDPGITFVFGLLEGYWRFSDFNWRPRHACVGPNTWRQILNLNGFDFVHIAEAYMGTMGNITAQTTQSAPLALPATVDAPLNERSSWIIFGCPDNLHRDLISKLSDVGADVHLVLEATPETVVNDYELSNPHVFISRIERDDLLVKLDAMFEGVTVQGVVYAWGMDTLKRDQRAISFPFFQLAQKLLTLKKIPKVFVCTRGIQPVFQDLHLVSNPAAATLFGMVKSLKNENADMLVRYIDLECDRGKCDDHVNLVDEILYELAMHKETQERETVQVAYREGRRYKPRFSRLNIQTKLGEEMKLPPSTSRYQLVLPESRMIQDLTYDVLEEESVGEMEVEVKVEAYALNFRDVFAVLKPIEEFERINAVGMDFAGVVTKLGRQVPEYKWQIGDRVLGVNTKLVTFHSHLTVDVDYVLKIPTKFTFAEACTLPVVFATSLYGLLDLAKLKNGETVLIHTGSGGVGLAAIQIAQHVGANIITTAGNPRKRAYLRSLGIQHVFHSRNTDYREQIMRVTQGRGVDIVLNSLTGPGFKEASLDVTARHGRFIEMSKLAVWKVEEVKERRPDVEYSIIDLIAEAEDSFSWKSFPGRLEGHLNEGNVRALPHVKFDALLLRQALQFLQKANHIGKVVVTMPQVKTVEGQWKVTVPLFNEQSTYIVTGGLGGIGFEVCKWMLEKGATDVVLIGRSPPKPEIAQEINRINNDKRFNVTVKLGDVGNFEEIKSIIEEIVENCGDKPIRGIQHCAGVLRDNMFNKQSWDSFEATFNPKVSGTWNLHELTRNMPLEHFVMYSSMTALAGTPSQSNHAAANCFEDAFGHYRYSMGLPATSINWGQWSQVGCAKEINLTGVLPVSVKRMLNGLEVALKTQTTQVAFGDFESFNMWATVCPMFKTYLDERLIKSLNDDRGTGAQVLLKSDQFWKEIDEVEEKSEKMQVITMYMKVILRGALRMEADDPINEDANMQDLGVDSLMLIELKNSIQGLMGSRVTVTATMLKDCHTIRELSTVLVNKICDEDENLANIPPLSPEEYTRLLEADCILEESIRPTLPIRGSVQEIKTILITGVTGQLGPYILVKIVEASYNKVEKIVCLIRTKEGKCPKEKLQNILDLMNLTSNVNMSKVECVRGDVTKPQFGLSDVDYKNLTESVDGVIHLTAKSNHVEVYRKCEENRRNVRSVNVEGTLNVLRFAVTGNTKHIYYASSLLAIFGSNADDTLCDDWPVEDEIKFVAENKVGGYPASKFVCEMLLKQANDRGIPCKIFRFPGIMGESCTGQVNYLNNHYILRLLSYLKIRSIPTAPIPALVLPVDVCAEWSLRLFWNEDVPNEIYNIAHPNPQLEVEFIEVAKEHLGIQLELVDWKSKEFIEKLYAKDMPLEALKELYENVDRGISVLESGTCKMIQGYIDCPTNFFSNSKIGTFLPGFSHNLPSTMDILLQNLLYVKSKGYFEKFGI